MKLRVRGAARTDIAEAASWYHERGERLSRRFLDEVEAKLHLVDDNPLLYPVVARDVRRAHLDRFPYSVLYHLVGDTPVVLAVLHDRRAPKHWVRRR